MMNKNELITVIVPVFRTEKYLERCVNSILNQTYKNFELLLIDDGSDDSCPELCDALAKKDCRIKVFHKKNGGLSSARNYGLDYSSGQYIAFVDSDDYVSMDYLSIMYDTLLKTNSDLVKINYQEVTGDTIPSIERKLDFTEYENEDVEKAFLDLKVDSACVFLYKKDLIGNTRFIYGKTSEDIPFNFEVFRKAKKFTYLKEIAYFYFYNILSISNGPLDKNMLNYLYFRKDIYLYYENQQNPELLTRSRVLYARAAMGLMTRMALYGIDSALDEKECKTLFKTVFKQHQKCFYQSEMTPFSRKVLSVLVFKAYPFMKLAGKIRGRS